MSESTHPADTPEVEKLIGELEAGRPWSNHPWRDADEAVNTIIERLKKIAAADTQHPDPVQRLLAALRPFAEAWEGCGPIANRVTWGDFNMPRLVYAALADSPLERVEAICGFETPYGLCALAPNHSGIHGMDYERKCVAYVQPARVEQVGEAERLPAPMHDRCRATFKCRYSNAQYVQPHDRCPYSDVGPVAAHPSHGPDHPKHKTPRLAGEPICPCFEQGFNESSAMHNAREARSAAHPSLDREAATETIQRVIDSTLGPQRVKAMALEHGLLAKRIVDALAATPLDRGEPT